MLLSMLRDGRLHLSGIALLAPLLTPDNRNALLMRATHRSKRQIQELVAELSPRPDVPSMMRKLPQTRQTPLNAGSDSNDQASLTLGPRGQGQAKRGALELVPDGVTAGVELVPDELLQLSHSVQTESTWRLKP